MSTGIYIPPEVPVKKMHEVNEEWLNRVGRQPKQNTGFNVTLEGGRKEDQG